MFFDTNTMTFQSEFLDGFVTLSDQDYCLLLDGRGQGNSIVLDEFGMPKLEPIQASPVDPVGLYSKYLADTDWYVVRFLETQTPIPSEVSIKRAEARAALSTD